MEELEKEPSEEQESATEEPVAPPQPAFLSYVETSFWN